MATLMRMATLDDMKMHFFWLQSEIWSPTKHSIKIIKLASVDNLGISYKILGQNTNNMWNYYQSTPHSKQNQT